MPSHKRTDIDQDDNALRWLSGCQYKVLQYLVNRADSRGICFPSAQTIADATGFNLRHVYRALEFINDCDVIRYLRRDAFDHVTRRKLPNAYQINPDYICLAVEFVAEARELWLSLTDQCGNRCLGLWSHINQQPTPVSQLQKPTPVDPVPEIQHQQPAAGKGNGRGADYANGKNAKNGGGHDDSETNHQREAPGSKSSVPPQPRGQYANPDPIGTNLPDALHEALAFEIRQIGISMPLARGFVVTYGYNRAKVALEAVTEMGQSAKSPPGLFRSILQNGLADNFALTQQKIFNNRRQ